MTDATIQQGERVNLLADLETVCGDIFDRWDKDMRPGKLLTALSGNMSEGYDPRVDRIRRALQSPALSDADKDSVLAAGGEYEGAVTVKIMEAAHKTIRDGAPGLSDQTCNVLAGIIARKASIILASLRQGGKP